MKLTPRDQILVNNLKVKNSNFTAFEHPGFFCYQCCRHTCFYGVTVMIIVTGEYDSHAQTIP